MAQEQSHIQLFNTDTMSGVFPGSRTQVYQRLRLFPLQTPEAGPQWAQLFWYAEPRACVLQLLTNGEPDQPLLRLDDPLVAELLDAVQAALRGLGWQLHSCGTCHFWDMRNEQTPDGLPLGHCRWGQTIHGEQTEAAEMAWQSCLALECTHWTALHESVSERPSDAHESHEPIADDGDGAMQTDAAASGPWQRFWQSVARWVRGLPSPHSDVDAASTTGSSRWLERSGVGAGTEACFVCQGRIANLGALAVESVEGDRQTFSVWRCRRCHTYYLNNWIDRWERLDSLETDESTYRIAPDEAVQLLLRMEAVTGGEHPGRRHERTAERAWFAQFMAQRERLSHQVKFGR